MQNIPAPPVNQVSCQSEKLDSPFPFLSSKWDIVRLVRLLPSINLAGKPSESGGLGRVGHFRLRGNGLCSGVWSP